MRGKNLLLNAGTIFSLGMSLAWSLLQPDAAPWILPALVGLSAILLLAVLLRNLTERRRHREWLWERVRRNQRALRETPTDEERQEDLYEALRELRRPWEMLAALEAWAAVAPDNKSVQRRLRELHERLGYDVPVNPRQPPSG